LLSILAGRLLKSLSTSQSYEYTSHKPIWLHLKKGELMKFLMALAFVTVFSNFASGDQTTTNTAPGSESPSIEVRSESLIKLSPILLQAVDESQLRGIDASDVEVHAVISMINISTELEATNLLSALGINAGSIVLGQYSIISARTDLEKILSLISLDEVIYVEGNDVLFPEPSFSAGN
jgi:hypothetical protein